MDYDYFNSMVALNVWAPIRLCQLAHPHLTQSTNGCVVMIGSIDAVRPAAGATIYGATKAALGAVTVALAKEWRNDGIRVNQIDPGLVDTPMAASVVQRLADAALSPNIAGRPGHADEVAALVHYLVAPAGGFVNGTRLTVDGGALTLGPFDLLED